MSDRKAPVKPRAGSGGSKRPGAQLLGGDRCLFTVWAPKSKTVEVKLVYPYEKTVELDPAGAGYFKGVLENVSVGTRYWYVLDDGEARPDPASRLQFEGVKGPSVVVNNEFDWQDRYWCGLPLEDYVFYELHVGAFTQEGTLDAARGRLNELKELGITAVELMPLAEFPGGRNWGYDGVFPYSVHHAYGGPAGLKRFVNAAHQLGLAVVLDVVYNHLGKEGACLDDFAPYYEKKYRTVWGPALNFDGRDSDAVKTFFLENALYWLDECRVDALRLDAVGAIH
ncbi:MAG: alpha-amylase family glycosyl hydrolase, partial [Elusimicrobiota bacterium]